MLRSGNLLFLVGLKVDILLRLAPSLFILIGVSNYLDESDPPKGNWLPATDTEFYLLWNGLLGFKASNRAILRTVLIFYYKF